MIGGGKKKKERKKERGKKKQLLLIFKEKPSCLTWVSWFRAVVLFTTLPKLSTRSRLDFFLYGLLYEYIHELIIYHACELQLWLWGHI